MLKLLSLWLAWRAVRLFTAAIVIVGALAVLAHGHESGARAGNTPLNQLRHVLHPLEKQLERTLERGLKR